MSTSATAEVARSKWRFADESSSVNSKNTDKTSAAQSSATPSSLDFRLGSRGCRPLDSWQQVQWRPKADIENKACHPEKPMVDREFLPTMPAKS
ncbi:hypothetical protein L917_08824 [Phytophthora nicotianae]|nr:hypothetical protein L917_08824 [Phytophthora nicotianae]